MKARVRAYGDLWIGEVLIDENERNPRWKLVTEYCYTRLGAKIQLKQYARRLPEEFEI